MHSCRHCQYKSRMDSKHSKVHLVFEMFYSKQREKCIHVDTVDTNLEWIQSIQRFIWYSKCSTQNRENTFMSTLLRYWMNRLHVDTVDMRLIRYWKCSTQNRLCQHCQYMLHSACNEISFHCVCWHCRYIQSNYSVDSNTKSSNYRKVRFKPLIYFELQQTLNQNFKLHLLGIRSQLNRLWIGGTSN